jgi:hypothetical protein
MRVQLPATVARTVTVLPAVTARVLYDRDGYVIGIEVE